MKKSHLHTLIMVALTQLPCTVVAKETINTNAVEVTATRVQRDILEVPLAVSVVTEDQIAKGGATVADLLSDIPGIQISNDGSVGLKRIGIRGEDPFRTVIMIDGQKISEHKSMSGTPILIDPSSIERIEVIKGPNSVLYGSDAIGGVVNIITKKETKDRFNVETGGGYDGASEAFREYIALSGKLDRLSYRFATSNTESGDLRTPDGVQRNTSYRQKSVSGLLSYALTDKLSVGVNADYFDSNINSTTDDKSSYDDFYVLIPVWKRSKVNIFAEMNDVNDYLSQLRFDAYRQLNEKIMENHIVTSSSSTSTAGPNTIHRNMRVSVTPGTKNRVYTNGISSQSIWQLGEKNTLVAGVGLIHDNLDAASTSYVGMDMNVTMTGAMNSSTSQHMDMSKTVTGLKGYQETVYGFLSNETVLPYDFTANYGIRYTHVKDRVSNNEKIDLLNNSLSQLDTGSGTQSRSVFNLGLVYSGIENTAIRFNYGQGFRAPILQEKYVTTSMGGSTVLGNKDLKAEKSDSYEIGIRHTSDKLYTDMSVFYTDTDDFISTKDIIPGSSLQKKYYNVSKAKTYGTELELSYKVFDSYSPYCSFTYTRRSFDNSNLKTYNTDLPAIVARYGVKSEFTFSVFTLNADAYMKSHSSRDYTISSGDSTSTTHHGGFTTANVEVSAYFGENKQYMVSAAWLNIGNKKYYISDAIAEPGSHAVITFNAKF